MWSGPRNVSTALMRSWGNRPDTYVCDEPLYAHYLQQTRLPHPGAEEVIAHHEADWQKVAAWLTGPIPQGKSIFYHKHMAHHLLPDIGRDWLAQLAHGFLIRDPKPMLISLDKVTPNPRLEDTGLPQQVEIFDRVGEAGGSMPVVIDARDLLNDPRGMLTRWCEQLGIPFTENMLAWPPGRRETDGIWAKHWYANVEKSTGFQPPNPDPPELPEHLRSLYEECMKHYRHLYSYRLRI
jgi:hypothetical protein